MDSNAVSWIVAAWAPKPPPPEWSRWVMTGPVHTLAHAHASLQSALGDAAHDICALGTSDGGSGLTLQVVVRPGGDADAVLAFVRERGVDMVAAFEGEGLNTKGRESAPAATRGLAEDLEDDTTWMRLLGPRAVTEASNKRSRRNLDDECFEAQLMSLCGPRSRTSAAALAAPIPQSTAFASRATGFCARPQPPIGAARDALIPTQLVELQTICLPSLPAHAAFFDWHEPLEAFLLDKEMARKKAESRPPQRPLLSRPLSPHAFYERFVARTAAQCAVERSSAQGSDAWLTARHGVATGTAFGSAVPPELRQFKSPYPRTSPPDCVREKLWPTFVGNVATRWGNAHEDDARDVMKDWLPRWLRQRFADAGQSEDSAAAAVEGVEWHEDGIMKFAEDAWMGVSADGWVDLTDADGARKTFVLEYKCAYYSRGKRDGSHPYGKYQPDADAFNEHNKDPRAKRAFSRIACVPPQYFAQVTGEMGYLNSHAASAGALPHPVVGTLFLVWTPMHSHVTLIPWEEAQWALLEAAVRDWYFAQLLPALTMQFNGQLLYGEIYPGEEDQSKLLELGDGF